MKIDDIEKIKITYEVMYCGNCGCTDHKLKQSEVDMLVCCNDCGNQSSIQITKPILSIEWVDGSDGLLTK